MLFRQLLVLMACCGLPDDQRSPGGPEASLQIFRDHVAPLLESRCLSCHQDAEAKGDFSLETSAALRESGHVVPGSPQTSLLLSVLAGEDGKPPRMPQEGEPLGPQERAWLTEWIQTGAAWPRDRQLSLPRVTDQNWWSLQLLQRTTIPQVPTPAWSRNPVDHFVLARLADKMLTPSPEAGRRKLVRRLVFDLLGLPPTPSQVETFLADPAPDAYERLVDRLLASPRYGERWARHWLDVAHYADTHGYDKDKMRHHAWPYRDYVIRSFNGDKPYGRFVLEQIAGDVLWPDTVDGITATGFIAAGPWDLIGHAEIPETKIDGRIARNLDRDDMVSSTLNTFCSTTIQCARCHNHKFDPITQEHYYSLQSVFAALDRANRLYDVKPETATRRASLKRQESELLAKKSVLDTRLERAAGDELAVVDAELATLENQQLSPKAENPEFGYHSHIETQPEITKWVQVDLGRARAIGFIVYVGCHDSFNDIGSGFGFPPRYKVEVSNDAEFQVGVTRLVDHTQDDVANPGTEPQIVRPPVGLKGRYVRITATRLAHRKDDYLFALAEILVLTPDCHNVARDQKVTSLDSIEAPVRWQRKNLVDGYYPNVTTLKPVLTRIDSLQQQRKSLLASALHGDLKVLVTENQAALQEVTNAAKSLPPQAKVYAGTIHRGKGKIFVGTGANGGRPRVIHILSRGDILSPTREVHPGTIPVIPDTNWRFQLPPSHNEGDRRVALADWLVRDNNPLTWRSIVNRVWQYHFGQGIVGSPNDFGRMGKLPSHPQLLDWLAIEFRDRGQSLKKLHKLLVTSSVYRQSSAHNRRNSQLDSENAYLWRMARRRLTAEEIRDAVLEVSGKLNPSMFGPGFHLFVMEQPDHSPHYEYHKHDPDDPPSLRRSIYRLIVRSQPDPFMTTLDCADSSQSVPTRDETVTALQALSLLNNKFMVWMAEHFSDYLTAESKNTSEQVEHAFQRVTGHLPTENQRRTLMRYTTEHGTDNLCRLLFNLNEFVFVD